MVWVDIDRTSICRSARHATQDLSSDHLRAIFADFGCAADDCWPLFRAKPLTKDLIQARVTVTKIDFSGFRREETRNVDNEFDTRRKLKKNIVCFLWMKFNYWSSWDELHGLFQ
jgi:hypothetical protein